MDGEIVELDGKKYVVIASVSPPDMEYIIKVPEGSYDRKEVIDGKVLWLKEYVENTQTTG